MLFPRAIPFVSACRLSIENQFSYWYYNCAKVIAIPDLTTATNITTFSKNSLRGRCQVLFTPHLLQHVRLPLNQFLSHSISTLCASYNFLHVMTSNNNTRSSILSGKIVAMKRHDLEVKIDGITA